MGLNGVRLDLSLHVKSSLTPFTRLRGAWAALRKRGGSTIQLPRGLAAKAIAAKYPCGVRRLADGVQRGILDGLLKQCPIGRSPSRSVLIESEIQRVGCHKGIRGAEGVGGIAGPSILRRMGHHACAHGVQ